jgi:hypothetical protein
MRKRVSLVGDGGCVSRRTIHVYSVNVKGLNSKFLQNRGGGYAFYLVTGGVPVETQSTSSDCAYHGVYKAIGT